ncbi:tol-pal system protein YbgF [Neptunicella sp.]|uniref:tol-pal system protein YbgF n=1 Tax=Neptunicella sp. TaxID=2125986 RepID=UPI003F694090
MIKHNIVLLSLLVTGAAVYAAPAPVVDVNSGNLEQRLAALERMVGTRTDMQQRLQQQLDSVQDEVNELRGSVELHTHKLEQILERQRELYQEIDKRIAAVMQKPAPTPVSEPAVNQTTQPAMGESDAYDQAVNLILKDKQYDQAIPQFELFLKQYPNSTYAANAYYWLGQLLFNKQDWTTASQRFTYLVEHYPDSTKRADSLLKLGMIAQKQNNLSKAEQLFAQVIAEYSGSTAAKLADSRLKNLK